MPDRTPGTRPGATWSGLLDALGARLGGLERRLRNLEERSGQSLPADYRFETDDDGRLIVRRVSTGDTAVIDV